MIIGGNRKFQLNYSGVANYLDMSVGVVDVPLVLKVETKDVNGVLYDPAGGMFVDIFDIDGKMIDNNIVPQHPSVGVWFLELVEGEFGTKIVRWKSGDGEYLFQMVVIVPMNVQSMMIQLGTLLDKALKDRGQTWGYTDVDLFMYLVNAVGYFNSVPPLTGYSVNNVPWVFIQKIVDLGVMYGVQAQMLYAIDTDISYNDQGISLNIDHFGKLSSFYGTVISRTIDDIKKLKTAVVGFSLGKVVMALNPERTRTYMYANLMIPGYPYFAFGLGMYQLLGISG